MNPLRVYYQSDSRASITDGNWIDPTYLPSTWNAQRIKLPENFRILPDLNRAVRHEFIHNFEHVFNFRRIDLQDECIDSLSTFFADKLYTYSLQENYTGAIRSTLESVKIKVYKNLRKCPGNPDPPTWRS